MNTKWKLLTLTALLSAGCTAASADETRYDEDAYFGDSSSYAQSLYEDDQEVTQVGEPVDYPADVAVVEDYVDPELQPVAYVGDAPAYQSPNVGHQQIGSGIPARVASHQMGGCATGNCGSSDCGCSSEVAYADSCGSSCGGACGSSACGSSRKRFSNLGGGGCETWMTAEALLWFPQVRSTPPIVSTSDPATFPILGVEPSAAVAFGGLDSIGDDLAPGFRIGGGRMINQNFGFGGRFWWLSELSDEYSNQGDGTAQSIGVPVFDTATLTGDGDAAIKVAYNDAIDDNAAVPPGFDPGLFTDYTGDVNSAFNLDMYGTEAYGLMTLLSGRGYQTQFVGGFSHFGIDEDFSLSVNAIQTDNIDNDADAGPDTGDVYRYRDFIDVENRFFGGQIGFRTTVNRGAWQLLALTKVHLGNMEQSWSERGTRTKEDVVAGVINADGGIFTAGLDRNGLSSDTFTFAPEANLKLSYKFRPHVRFSVGYSFLMWSDVLSIGDNLDASLNGDALFSTNNVNFGAPVRSASYTSLVSNAFYVQGIDLGCVINF